MAQDPRANASSGMEERNIARLAPVLALNRVPAGMTGWKKTVQVDGLGPIEVSCLAGRNQVVPHGIDADVMFALTTMYYLQQQLKYGVLRVSVADLCRAVGLARSANMYERIRESLLRLRHVSYQVVDCWASPTKKGHWNFSSLDFGIVDSIEQIDLDIPEGEAIGQYKPTSMLRIRLSPELVDSIRDGHVRAIDLDFYAGLEQPLSRLLYRTLEEQRNLPGADHRVLRVPLIAWGDHLGLRGLAKNDKETAQEQDTTTIPETEVLSPNKLRRALTPAHEELGLKGYLKGIEFVGRGRDQRLDYTFGLPTQAVDLNLVALLTARGISAPAAEKQVRTHLPEAIHAAVAKFEARKKGGYTVRNPGGLLSDMLSHPEKYPSGEVSIGGAPTPKAARPVTPLPTEEPPTPVREARAAVIALGRPFEATATLRRLRDRAVALYLAEKVTTVDLASLSTLEPGQIERLLVGWEQDRT